VIPTLPPMDIAARAAKVRTSMGEAGCDALLVTALVNVRWLTGFTGSAARVMLLPDELVLVTDGRYGDQAIEQLAAAGVPSRVEVGRSQPAQREILAGLVGGVTRIGLEAQHVSWADHDSYRELFADSELVATTNLVEAHRIVKDDGEVARIEAAATIASQALADVFHLLDEEATEAEFALALDTQMRHLGAEGPSFPTIVASGPNSALPHHQPNGRRIVAGDLVVIDYGALVDGYHSDMTRTAVVGELTPQLAEIREIVTAAQAAGVAAVKAGVRAADVDATCRTFIAEAGYGDQFLHPTGHGMGLLIHEAPWLNAVSDDVLPAGAVVSVEPGVYLVSSGGVRVEDAVLVTTDGCRPLTSTPKDLSCLRSPRTISRTE
jgi:Xaa-Pro aminopeptidase